MGKSKLTLVHSKILQISQPSNEPNEIDSQGRTLYIEQLFGKYRGALKRYLMMLVQNEDDAGELLQELYLRLLEQNSLSHLEVNTRAYLFRIATNLVRDKSRRDKVRAREMHLSVEEDLLPGDETTPDQHMIWDRALQKIKAGILELPPKCQQIFIMNRYKNMNYSDIAKVMGVTTRTVERNMSLALTQLKAKLEESDDQ